MKDRVLIIDGLNFIYRGLISFGGKNENEVDYTVVYNFFRNFRALIERFEPNKCFVVLEGVPEFRYNLFPEYKKNRIIKSGSKQADTKANVLRQADIIIKMISWLPVTLVRAAKYEADDTIYTLAKNLKEEELIIVSSDSDLIQILQSLHEYDVKLFNSTKKEFVEAPAYVYLVWKSIAGDKKSDNIPSVTSADKATHLAQHPEDLKEFLSNEENRANFVLNKQLIELQVVPDEELEFTGYNVNFDALFAEFEKMALPSLIKEEYKEKFISTFEDTLIQ